ncbi:hypothetical protein F511_16662 [Dorcoceras hygrometricum]|uniref:Uncharacterized protein n=1 Tax=Dorcoceras hygrometricum TaxID=472368 RepID=A0A2Z7D6S0_9LAMI|nr:hypothetical protein F511_16662 [Dorcoceras hygrometricum]
MASVFITNAQQVNFESVLGISYNDGMVNIFKVLESTGLRGFLGCSSVLYEQELEQLFDTALVQDNDITCVIFWEARTMFSKSEKHVQYSCKKRLLKYEFRLLNDILAKSITVKAGSFDAVTHERFFMITAIHFGVKINWSKILFEVLKEMADTTIIRAKDIVAIGPVMGDVSIPRRVVDFVSYRIQIIDSFLPEPTIQTSAVVDSASVPPDFSSLSPRNSDISLPSPHQSPSTDSSLHFNSEDILQGAATVVQHIPVSSTAAPATNINEQFAQLRTSISEISINQLRDLENAIFSKIITREKVAAEAFRAQNAFFTTDLADLHKEVKDLKAELSQDFNDKLAIIRNDLLEFRLETQGQLASLSTNLAELIAFVTKGRDDKKGEVSSSHGRGQPSPGDGSGSRSEPSRKRGSSGSRQKIWIYWINE